jgi:hypothetical protein
MKRITRWKEIQAKQLRDIREFFPKQQRDQEELAIQEPSKNNNEETVPTTGGIITRVKALAQNTLLRWFAPKNNKANETVCLEEEEENQSDLSVESNTLMPRGVHMTTSALRR